MKPLSSYKSKPINKLSCPFQRKCFTDSSICGYIGYYLECPPRLDAKIYAEIKEGTYEGVTPYDLFRAVRHG
ncbi:copy number control protein CopG [Sulfolobus islandicus L.S.2.15]|uniref:Copy number control protein CopG n=1 Tax=Saccharolobus islandicus (strain L.S.2.15 / Lassen \|nr:copy number control protein CopG [Sulfolobus islandicus L.S.2.15]